MKLKGQIITPPSPRAIIVPRDEGDLIFHAKPIIDFDEFEKICPMPDPPLIQYPDGGQKKDYDDLIYRKAVLAWSRQRTDWIVLTSLSVTEGLEWDTVDLNKPDTYKNYMEDFKKSGFSIAEVDYIIKQVLDVNSMDESKFDEARKRFLASKRVLAVG
jgi:hypothetical protein